MGRGVISRTAALNGVADQVDLRGEATANLLNELPVEERDRSVLFVDIEGAEFNLFGKEMFDGFSKSIIFVELHDWFYEDAKGKMDAMLNSSKETHSCKFIKMASRDLSVYPELQRWPDLPSSTPKRRFFRFGDTVSI